MSLTRLSNLISSTEGRFLYVDPNEFNASDLITNRGNSPTRPFKTLQRALLEVARFSYVAGPDRGNDKYDQYTVLLSPGDHWIDNRPGYFVNWDTTANYWDTDQQIAGVDVIPQLTDQSNFDIFDDDNDLFKFNSVEGGIIIPRGTSLVGSDLRKTRIRPRYVPDPMYADYLEEKGSGTYEETTDYKLPNVYLEEAPSVTLPRASFFRVTGGCYFWQFSIFDAVPTNTGGIFRYASNDPSDSIKFTKYSQNYEWKTTKESLTNTDTTGLGSHHKLTGFAFANGMTVPDITLSANVASADTSINLNKINSGSQARIHMGDYLLIDNATNASKEIVKVKKVYTALSKVDVYRSQLGTSAPVQHDINTTVTKLNDLGLFYAKIARGFSSTAIEDAIVDAQGEVEARQQENRIVGPLNVDNKIASISITKVVGTKYKLSVNTRGSHGLFKGQIISLINLDATQTSQSSGFGGDINGTVFVSSVLNATTIECEKILAPNTVQQTYVFNQTAAATLIADIDTVDSASPYIFNCSIRSVFGICGMFCDGSKATGFKSMVVAQYTGVSLQKDDRAFIKYMYQNLGNPDIGNNVLMEPVFLKEGETGNVLPSDPTPTKVSTLHSDGAAYYQDNWRTFHIHIRYEGLIQAVSVFAVGFCDHHLIEDGGDISITNSNSNFGNTALRAVGFREKSFPQDKVGKITHIIPPKKLDPDEVKEFSWYPFDTKKTQASNTSNRKTRLYLFGADLPSKTPTYIFDNKFIFGGKANEFVYSDEKVGNKTERLETYLATNTDSDGVYEHVQIKTFNVNPNTDICKLKTTGDSYRWYTGTPVRISSEVGYLPDGMTPNTTYYIITENGSRWKDANWTDGTGNISNVANEFKLAKTIEEARAGTSIDLRSQNPPTNADINNPNKCELKIYQYTSDVKPIPIKHEFKTESTTNEFICVNDGTSPSPTEIAHGFDAGQPIYFSKGISSDTLPSLSSGALSTQQFYYAYPTSRTRFKITQDDPTTGGGRAAAIAGNSLITLGPTMAAGSTTVWANNGQWTTDTEYAGANGTSWESRQPLQYDPTRLNNQVVSDILTYGNWCILTENNHVPVAGTTQQSGNKILNLMLTDNQYTSAEGASKTSRLSYITRQKDNRPNYDRTYRYRYVLPKDNRDARAPFLGYIVKLRTNDDGYVMDTWTGGAPADYTQYERTYYIYNIDEIQDFIPQVQDGVYYLTLILGDIEIDHGKMVRGESGNLAQNWFKKHKFSQSTAELYPALDADNPVDNPDASKSCADHRVHGFVYSDIRTNSTTREGAEAFLLDNKYTTAQTGTICVARDGFARRGREDQSRLYPIGYLRGNSSNRSDDVGIEVELRRPSLIRSGNHTFEYVGYGPGNYSTAFPSKQQRDLSDREIVVSQAKKEDAGVVFYSGLNSQGDLYVGTQKINAVTGQIEIIDESILEISSIPEEERKANDEENENEDTELPDSPEFHDLTVKGILIVENSDDPSLPSSQRIKGSTRSHSVYYGGIQFNTPMEADNPKQRINFYGAPNGYDPAAGGEYHGIHGLLSTNNLNMRAIRVVNRNNEDNIDTEVAGDAYTKDITLWGSTTRPTAYANGGGQSIVNLFSPAGGSVTSNWALGKNHGDIAYKPKGSFGSAGKNNHSWIYLPSGTGGTLGHWYCTGLTQTGGIYPFEDQSTAGNTGSLGINAIYRAETRRSELYVKGSGQTGANLKRDYYIGIDDQTNNPIFWMKKDGSGASAAEPSALFFTNSPSTEISQMVSGGTELHSFEVANGHTAKFGDEVLLNSHVYIQSNAEFLGATSGIIIPTNHNSLQSFQNSSDGCFLRMDGTTSVMEPSISTTDPLGDAGSNPQKSNVYGNWSNSGKEFTSAAPTVFDAHIRDDIQNQALPVGGIILWGGAYSNMPKGYCLCDGGTHKDRFGNTITVPDLRDKFVKGGSTTATGTMTGGYDENEVKTKLSIYGHELSRPETPAHSHGLNENYFRHSHGITVQVGLNDLIGAKAGNDNPDAAFGTNWGSAAHTLVTIQPDPIYDGQNSKGNTDPASNAGAFLDLSGVGNMRTGPGVGGGSGGGGGSTTWNTIYGPGYTSQNYVELSGQSSGSWQVTYPFNVTISPVRAMAVRTTATSTTWSQPPTVTVDIDYDLGAATQVSVNGIHTTNTGWTTVWDNAADANNYMETTVSAAGLAGSGMMGFHFFYQGQLRAINPYGTNGPSYLNGTWNYWGVYRFKGEGLVSGNTYKMTVQRMTFGTYNHSATKRYEVGDVWNIPGSATHTTASQMSFTHKIQEETFSGGGGGGTYNFYYNGSNVGSNTTGGILTVGSLRYTMGSSVGNNQYQIKVEQQQTSGGSGTDWHDLSANPGRDDPRRTDTPSGSANAGNSLGKSTTDFKALHHHHPFQFSDDSSSAGVTVTTAGSSGYGQGINSYGATLDEFSTLSFTLDNRPAYLELCYICKL